MRIPPCAESRSVYRRRQGWIVVVVEAKFYIAATTTPYGGGAGKLRRLDPLMRALCGELGERTANGGGVRTEQQRDGREQSAHVPATRAHGHVQSSTAEPVW